MRAGIQIGLLGYGGNSWVPQRGTPSRERGNLSRGRADTELTGFAGTCARAIGNVSDRSSHIVQAMWLRTNAMAAMMATQAASDATNVMPVKSQRLGYSESCGSAGATISWR